MEQEEQTHLTDREREMIQAIADALGVTFEQAATELCRQGMVQRYGLRARRVQVIPLRSPA